MRKTNKGPTSLFVSSSLFQAQETEPGSSFLPPQALLLCEGPAFLHRHRFAEIVSLGVFNSDFFQEFVLFFRFHPFTERREIHPPGSLNNISHQRTGLWIMVQAPEEDHIQDEELCYSPFFSTIVVSKEDASVL